MRSSWVGVAGVVVLAGLLLEAGCREKEANEEGEVPSLLRVRFESEMKTILRDLKAAEEMAAASEGRYLELDELRKRYLSREIPETYDLSLTDVSASAFRAEIVHRGTGLSCSLAADGDGGGGGGVPTCR